MGHRAFVGPLLAILLVGFVAGFGSQAVAQQDTPAATPAGEAGDVGISFEPFAITPVETLPAAPALLILGRDRLEPGGVNVVPPDPGLGLIAVETGVGQITVEAPIVVTRAGTGGESGTQETIPANTPFTVGPGDSFIWPPNAGGVVRNEGSEPTTAIVSAILPQEMATPSS
jgi:hypothetical protein